MNEILNKIPLNAIIKASPNQAATELDGEAVILNLENGVYYGLDEIGTYIWGLLQTPHTFGDLVDLLLEEYEIDRETCQRDVQALLVDMHSHGLITHEA